MTPQTYYLKVLYHCTDFIGFSAYATNSQEPNEGDLVMFSSTHVNAGGGYDTSTSIFTCPTTGFYYIYFSLSSYIYDYSFVYENDCLVGIRMDGNIMVTVTSER